MRILISCIFALCVASIFAEPVAIGTKSEILSAKGLIEDLVRSGTGAEELLSLAKESAKGAERYWLYANAFILQAKDGKFDEATETVKELRSSVTGIPDVELESLIELNAEKGLAEVSELSSILRETKMRIAAQKLAIQLKQKVRKNPKADGLKVSLAEALAVSGEWDAALKMFSETKDGIATIAKAELDGKSTAKIAAFWWDYKPCRALSATTAFKAHAVEMYVKLLDSGTLSSLEKKLAENRVEQIDSLPVIEQGSRCVENKRRGDANWKEKVVFETAETNGEEWYYTFTQPAANWMTKGYIPTGWKKGRCQFGHNDGRRYDGPTYINTSWTTAYLWLRKSFDVSDIENIGAVQLRYYIDDIAEIWINGIKVYEIWKIYGYRDVPDVKEFREALKNGQNVIAVKMWNDLSRKCKNGGFDLGVKLIHK